MSSMIDPIHPDTMAQSATMTFAGTAHAYRIKRPGARPIVFDGIELAMAMSYTPALPYWYEINLYRTSDQRFIASIRLFFQSADEQDQTRAWEFDTLDQALEKLAAFDAGQDVRFVIDPADETMSPSQLAAMAMELRARILAAQQHYKSLVGEFFYELETMKTPLGRARA